MVRRLAGLSVACATLLIAAAPAAADRTFAPRFSANDAGDVTLIANTLMTCPASAATCAGAQAGTDPTIDNLNDNAYAMGYVDVDGDATTFNSSQATLNLPADAVVLFAGLYHGADVGVRQNDTAAPDAANRAAVLFRTPADTGYQPLSAASAVLDDSANPDYPGRYQAFHDVTAQVRAAGDGVYSVANVQAARGTDHYAGWSLVIAYRDPAGGPRAMAIFDGLQTIVQNAQPTDIVASGFRTPPTGPVTSSIGLVTYEGDLGILGDTATLNSSQGSFPLADAQNPNDNYFNSSISLLGARVTTKNPDYPNQLGFDADILNGNGALANNDTTATIRVTTNGDQYLPGVITFSTDLYAPRAVSTKTVTNLTRPGATTTAPGDRLRYTVTETNQGTDAATGFVIEDVIPARTTYVPGSMSGGRTDAAGDDTGEFAGGLVRFRVGSGASATQGGRLATGESATVSFDVTVNPDTPSGTTIVNRATADFVGETLGDRFNDLPTPAATTTVSGVAPANLSMTKTAAVAAPAVGSNETFTLLVRNAGPGRATGVTVTDPLPAGLELVSAVPSQGTCAAGVPVRCALGTVASGGSAQVLVTARVTATAGTRVTNTATVSGDQPDPTPGDNGGAVTITVGDGPAAPQPRLSLTKSVDDATSVVGQKLKYTLTVANAGPVVAKGVKVVDTFAGEATIVRVRSSAGTCTTDQPVTCRIKRLAVGAEATIRITATPSAAGRLKNTGAVTARNGNGGRASSAIDSAFTQVGGGTAPALKVTKRASVSSADAGDVIRYRIRVRNTGTAQATGVKVCDRVPSGLSLVSARGARFADGKACWTVGTLAAGAAKSFTVRARAQQLTTARRVVNRARATADGTSGASGAAGVRISPGPGRDGGVTG